MDLNGKVAIVTGAGRGIGRAISKALVAEGATVVLVARSADQLRSLAHEIDRGGGNAYALPADLGVISETRRIVEWVMDDLGRLDVLINNAAVLQSTPLLDVSESEWDKTFAVNVKGSFFLSQHALRVMADSGDGYIINVSSTAALQVPAALATYGTSKMALAAVSEALYQEGKNHGVKVSVLYPGMTDTEMLRGFNPPVDPEKWMKPTDISETVLFLLKQSGRVVVKEITPWATRHDRI